MNKDALIWVLEDDAGSRFVYEEILGLHYPLRLFEDLGEFSQALMDVNELDAPKLVIADIRLPDGSLINYLTGEKSKMLTMPFIVVSSVDDVDALRFCFEKGATDYLTKPFGKGELIVKVERIIRGMQPDGPKDFNLDQTTFTVERNSLHSVLLTSKEFQIMALLQNAPNYTITRDELLTRVWGGVKVTSKTLDVHLFNLRKKVAPLSIEIKHQPPDTYYIHIQASGY